MNFRSNAGMDKTELTPSKFFAVAKVLNSIPEDFKTNLDDFIGMTEIAAASVDEQVGNLAKNNNDLLQELRISTKNENIFRALDEQKSDTEDYQHTLGQGNFIRVAYNSFRIMQEAVHTLLLTADDLVPRELLMTGQDLVGKTDNHEKLQLLMYEMQLNAGAVNRWITALNHVDNLPAAMILLAKRQVTLLEGYHKQLLHRHSVEGVKIHRDPILTDIAMSVYENIDSHGEIDQDGKKPNEVSAYTLRKAEVLASSVKTGSIAKWIANPGSFLEYIQDAFKTYIGLATTLKKHSQQYITAVKGALGVRDQSKFGQDNADYVLVTIGDLDPRNVAYKEKSVLLSPEEKFNAEFRNDTLAKVTELLTDSTVSVQDLVTYVLARKAELRKFFQEENSFYVCRIGSGNPFLGDAPGALQVIPGPKPVADFDSIAGSGFAEVKDFFNSIGESAQWHDLFMATSPSKSADKNNVLLIGPPGCHRKGQKILMFDGTMKNVEHIVVGDQLMGPDSKPRIVEKLHSGTEEMVEISPNKGEPWVVNKNHILTLVRMGQNSKFAGEVVDISVKDYQELSPYMRNEYKLFRVGVEFNHVEELTVDPYFVGALLGDGSIYATPGVTIAECDPEILQEVRRQADKYSLRVMPHTDTPQSSIRHNISGVCHHPNPLTTDLKKIGIWGSVTENKFIPHQYKTASREARLQLLAGILDTDGSLSDNCYDFHSKSEKLANDVLFVARSLGFAAYIRDFIRDTPQGNIPVKYFRVKISGEVNQIPVKIPRKIAAERRQIKDVLRVGLSLKDLPPEEYFGFTVDGDHRYLLGDFTVTHNCGKSEILRAVGADSSSLSVFAQGSDFGTCWKGESEKNPKRLFEAGLKLQKESKKHVHFLIDEIDAVLNNDKGMGVTNLTLEFQILMDGVVSYPNLSVWGATNFPDRIPLAMLRRFSLVKIVGELNQKDRVNLLKQFINYLPIDHFGDTAWESMATKLDGATGDVIRKVADHLWRTKMSEFVRNQKKEAKDLVEFLNEEGKFQIAKLDDKKRFNFKQKLSKHLVVLPKDVEASINLHLRNVAFQAEIQSAKETYARAKEFLNSFESTNV